MLKFPDPEKNGFFLNEGKEIGVMIFTLDIFFTSEQKNAADEVKKSVKVDALFFSDLLMHFFWPHRHHCRRRRRHDFKDVFKMKKD